MIGPPKPARSGVNTKTSEATAFTTIPNNGRFFMATPRGGFYHGSFKADGFVSGQIEGE